MANEAYQVIMILVGLGAMITTLEFLSINKEFDARGIYSWRVLQLELPYRLRTSPLATVAGLVYGQKGMIALLSLRLVSAVLVVVLPIGTLAFSCAIGLLVGTTLIFTARQGYGQNGADQMTSIIAVTALLAVGIVNSPLALEAGLWFIALQACLAYAAAGVAKLVSPTWRSGDAVGLILRCGTYGTRSVAAFLARHPRWSAALSWSTVTFEVLFPLCLFVPEPAIWLFLGGGLLFHFSIAAIMGLNDFFWAFAAPYPAIYYVSTQVRAELF